MENHRGVFFMRKRKKSIIIIGAVFLLLLSTLTVSAESDPEGDVYHQSVMGHLSVMSCMELEKKLT